MDFFLYGLDSDEAATKKAWEVINHFADDGQVNLLNISTHCITAQIEKKTIQVVLRRYKSPGEILIGFDLPCCAIGFDGQKVLFTPLSAFCISKNVNVVDLTRCSTTFETRINKYFERDVAMIFPNLDIKKMSQSKYAELGKLYISYSKISGFVIETDDNKFRLVRNQSKTEVSDYGLSEIGSVVEYYTNYLNAATVASAQKTDSGYTIGDRNISWTFEDVNVQEDDLTLPKQDILKGLKKLYKEKKSWLLSFVTNYKDGDQLGHFKYLSVPYTKLVEILNGPNAYETLSKLFDAQYEIAKQVINSCVKNGKLNWKSVEPGTQIVGSFNPIPAHPQDFYREFYTENPTPVDEPALEKLSDDEDSSDDDSVSVSRPSKKAKRQNKDSDDEDEDDEDEEDSDE
jgi:hypothetical protein